MAFVKISMPRWKVSYSSTVDLLMRYYIRYFDFMPVIYDLNTSGGNFLQCRTAFSRMRGTTKLR